MNQFRELSLDQLQPLTGEELRCIEGGVATLLAMGVIAVAGSLFLGGVAYGRATSNKLGGGLKNAINKTIKKPNAS